MSRSSSIHYLFLFLSIAVTPTVFAETRAQEETAIRNLMGSFTADWHISDAHALSMYFLPDGDFINPDGALMRGRPQIEQFYAQAFGMGYAGSTATATVDQLRFLKADLALIDGEFGITGAITKDHQQLPAERGRYTAILKKQAGHWWIISNREMEPPNRGAKN